MSEKQGVNEVLIEPLKQFARDSIHLVKKCTKPDRKEFTMIARAVGTGLYVNVVERRGRPLCTDAAAMFVSHHVCHSAIMGFIGFFVKLVHIPINNILIGQ
jgi:protein transport protein SEC61 subunit gamma and related proteins